MNLAFPHSRGVAADRLDDFFRWVPEDAYRTQTDPEDVTFKGLVEVTDGLVAAFAEEVRSDALPQPGFYIVYIDDQGLVQAFEYGEDEEHAIEDVMPWVRDSLYGEDDVDLEAERPFTITVVSTHKPAQAVATAEAVVRVTGRATAEQVIDAGLAALHESRSSLFGYGIRDARAGEPIEDRTVTVYAHRD